jgi:uncharacterized protein (TIGR00251 family)
MAIQERNGSVTISVRVQPKASRTELAGAHGDALKIRLAAPPVDGEANQECVRFLARTLGVARSAVEIVSGHASKTKVVRVAGVTADEARRLLGLEN